MRYYALTSHTNLIHQCLYFILLNLKNKFCFFFLTSQQVSVASLEFLWDLVSFRQLKSFTFSAYDLGDRIQIGKARIFHENRVHFWLIDPKRVLLIHMKDKIIRQNIDKIISNCHGRCNNSVHWLFKILTLSAVYKHISNTICKIAMLH